MKTLIYETTGVLQQNGSATPAFPGDQVRLYLDQEYNSNFPEFVVGVIQNPIQSRCGMTTYRISYDDSDLPEGIEALRPCDVINVVITSCCDVLNDRMTEIEDEFIRRDTTDRLIGLTFRLTVNQYVRDVTVGVSGGSGTSSVDANFAAGVEGLIAVVPSFEDAEAAASELQIGDIFFDESRRVFTTNVTPIE